MRKSVKLFLLVLISITLSNQLTESRTNRNLLTGSCNESQLASRLVPRSKWHPFPTSLEHEKWQSLAAPLGAACIQEAEKLIKTPWSALPATTFLDYARNGNRSNYEQLSFSRRQKLAVLVMAEVIENKNRFLDEIANGIWAICEESYWGVPAHLGLQHAGSGLPDVTEPTVDLFAAETGDLLAWTVYLLEDKLKAVSPLLPERIYVEADRRILTPCLARDDFWWMGFSQRQDLNNWTPWIDSNWMATVLILERNPERRSRAVYKIMRSLDQFLNGYPEDGGCDEGPGYWGRAGASLFDCLELLEGATGGTVHHFQDPLIQKIGQYIYKAYIKDDYYLNFADASGRLQPECGLIYRYGKKIEDPVMTSFGAFLSQRDQNPHRWFGDSLLRTLPDLFVSQEMSSAKGTEPLLQEAWFPDLQVMVARMRSQSSSGFYLAAKGGHNAESHNHNDVGNFILYDDGHPVLIDVGVETYTAKTFSSKRYEIWTMQSGFHNLPTINGVMQKDGRQYQASQVNFSNTAEKAVFSLELAAANPAEAHVKSWIRTLTLDRHTLRVELHEQYHLEELQIPFQLNLMTPLIPDNDMAGIVRLKTTSDKIGSTTLIHFDANKFQVKIEPIEIQDGRLKTVWGEIIHRIRLESKSQTTEGEYTLQFTH
jgi:hypothetical protein